MHEVIHLSFGTPANELNSEFYNSQQSYFVYKKEDLPDSHVDPHVRFVYGKEFTPRAAFWDYRNGFAKWKQYNDKYQEPQSQDSIAETQGREITTVKKDDLASETWTSRIKVPIHPSGLNTIPDWEMDPEKYPLGHLRGSQPDDPRQFDSIEEGENEYAEVCKAIGGKEEYIDQTFRPIVEKCDMLDGINLVTDLGGWAGVSVPYLEALRDDYVPKSMIFSWAISHKVHKLSRQAQKSRVGALIGLAEHSSLVLPFQDTEIIRTAHDFQINALNHLPIFETVSLLSSLRKNRVPMFQLYQDLTTEIPHANIVQLMDDMASHSALPEFKVDSSPRVRNVVDIYRGPTPPEIEPPHTDQNREQHFSSYYCPQPIGSMPTNMFKFELQINNSPLNLRRLSAWGDHDFREQVYDATDAYIWGWDEPSDDSDF